MECIDSLYKWTLLLMAWTIANANHHIYSEGRTLLGSWWWKISLVNVTSSHLTGFIAEAISSATADAAFHWLTNT